jgi:23S rRNA (adenine2503-C2)-methyltransferase
MLPEDLVAHLASAGTTLSLQHARRLLSRHHGAPGRVFPNPRVRRAAIEAVEATTERTDLDVVERATDPSDGFVKYLLRSPDGALTEAVRIPLKKPGRFTVCLSSQVGCAMGCTFCATGRLGLTRNLEAWEMVSAWRIVRREAPGTVTGAVFQGQGEPLHNYDAVIQAARVLSEPACGALGARAITISTVGLVPAIRRYAREGHRYRLIVSLTSARPEVRRRLLPVAGRFDVADLADALREYEAGSGSKGRTTVALVLMSGVNTSREEAAALGELLGDLRLRINIIDVNDARDDGFRPPTDAERGEFIDALQALRVPIVRRYSGGKAKHAACGMLASVR